MRKTPKRRSAIALCIPVIGCLNTDFGRVRDFLVTDDMHRWLGAEAVQPLGEAPSEFPLTDDERLLRDLAYPLIEPPYERQRWYAVLSEYGLTGSWRQSWWSVDPNRYTVAGVAYPARSTSTMYRRLNDDIRNDVERVGPFFVVAHRVADMDRKRERSLAYVSAASERELVNARRRVAENTLIVDWVHRSLLARAAVYRFALERLVIAVPSPFAVEAERSLTLLHLAIERGRLYPAPRIVPAPVMARG
jgi:hypothetical protein